MVSEIARNLGRARDEVVEARHLVAVARRVEWRSPTVARYLGALDALDARLAHAVEQVDVAQTAAAAADEAAHRASVGVLG
ncbi:hypothetical protein [Cellulomonas fimi]|uniref:Uncharacterized protein n=1 Tax=Cellulomonas fimi (strain ATCC 484 / DSM 20113 / JCM 1341 / CCUG 24087 / LMG 16345 / NBRC 15513 / NCIMB 8980 / NCTC 7547 / NRS-133) TaxID=590998 RepID=F4H680_CELFA|nr:hypothetical protein [Cellulomonas fimi]AEE44392.1 hypothetical protein Celf_0247 [Cellulomonas fimi ATCC 484]NNH08899.1 hypothetical protein [Cellulomonas fimi]VEH26269.1 Uncharacterised protein [Cellulomonas fimi]